MFDTELLELICLCELNGRDHLSCNPMCYIIFCESLLHGLIFLETAFFPLWQLFSFLWEKRCNIALFGTHSFTTPRNLLFLKEFPAVGSSNLTCIFPSKGLLGLLKWIYFIVPIEGFTSLSATLILTVEGIGQFGRGSNYLKALSYKYLFPHCLIHLHLW